MNWAVSLFVSFVVFFFAGTPIAEWLASLNL